MNSSRFLPEVPSFQILASSPKIDARKERSVSITNADEEDV